MPRGLKRRIRRLLKRQRSQKKISRKSKRFLRKMNYLILNPPAIIVHHHKKCHHKHHRHGHNSPQKSEYSLKNLLRHLFKNMRLMNQKTKNIKNIIEDTKKRSI